MIYATEDNYRKYYGGVPENFEHLARQASHNIDTLTYNRIIGTGWDNLTPYQQEVITECCCELIQFTNENADMLDGVLNSYAINGVSMQFDFNTSVRRVNGVIIRSSTYGRLMSTGLCYGGIR